MESRRFAAPGDGRMPQEERRETARDYRSGGRDGKEEFARVRSVDDDRQAAQFCSSGILHIEENVRMVSRSSERESQRSAVVENSAAGHHNENIGSRVRGQVDVI